MTAVGDTRGRGLWRQNKDTLIEVPGKEVSIAPLLIQKCCPAFIMEMCNLWGKDSLTPMEFKWLTTSQVSLQVIQGLHLQGSKVTFFFFFAEHTAQIWKASTLIQKYIFKIFLYGWKELFPFINPGKHEVFILGVCKICSHLFLPYQRNKRL